MATRYTPAPRAVLLDDPDVGVAATADEIILTDEEYIPSGLFDSEGRQLYRRRERVPFGFVGRS